MFPTTIGISPDGAWAYVPNSDFHGDRGHLNDVSVLYLPDMRQVVEIPTCDMPHGSRFSRSGQRVYIACMMSDELVEIDPSQLAIARRGPLGGGGGASHAAHDAPAPARPAPGAASSTQPGQNPDCLATYVSVSPDDRLVYVACSKSHDVQVRHARTLALVHRLPAGDGTYNVEPSPDGRWVLATNKKAQSVSVFDTGTWRETARVPTSKRVPHGIAFSPDGRYAFVSVESVGSDPGAVDAIDLTTMRRVASLVVPYQPTGIAVKR
jgi:YVTN family beta-propeller protein